MLGGVNLNIMETYYFIIGKIVVVITSGSVVIVSAWYVIARIVDFIGKRFNTLWRVVEYAYYHKQFKKWMKDNDKKSVTGRF